MQTEQRTFKLSSGVKEQRLENGLKILIKKIPASSTASVL